MIHHGDEPALGQAKGGLASDQVGSYAEGEVPAGFAEGEWIQSN